MAFWSDRGANVPEPKRNFRWVLYLGGMPQWLIKKVTKPSFTVTEAEHRYLNHKFYYPGAVEWQTVSVTLVDPLVPDAAQTIYDILRHSGYHAPKDQSDLLTVGKGPSVNSLGTVRIQQIGTTPKGNTGDTLKDFTGPTKVVEEWFLYNCWVKDAKFGDLDYTSDDLTELTLELRYDFAKLNNDNEAGDTDAAAQSANAVPGITGLGGGTPDPAASFEGGT